MSIVSLAETHGLLQHDLVIWSEAHQDKWATNDHNCSPEHYAKKKKKQPHASYPAKARAAWRAIYFSGTILLYMYIHSAVCFGPSQMLCTQLLHVMHGPWIADQPVGP